MNNKEYKIIHDNHQSLDDYEDLFFDADDFEHIFIDEKEREKKLKRIFENER